VAAATLLVSASTLGQPTTIPNGPYGENESLASLRSYAQLIGALESAVHASHGGATLHYAPWKSNGGRQVPYVVIGNGPTAALIIAQQHGDEMETSDSAVNLVRTLVNSSAASQAIRGKLTVVVVPRVNVDGFDGEKPDGTPLTDATGMRTPPWRQNWDPRFTVNPLPAFYARGLGYDINRYHGFRPEAIVEELAKDATLAAFDPNMADILVVPANELPPSPGNEGEVIVEGLVADPAAGADDQHLGN
jgi:hypothetical protein